MGNIHLHWFRNDLRLADVAALSDVQKADFFLPVYILDPRMYAQHPLGFPKMGFFKMKFLLECLQDLHRQLNQKGSRLLVFNGYPEQILPELARRFKEVKITAGKEYTFEEMAVEDELQKAGLSIQYFHDLTLIHPDDLPFQASKTPDIFTQFRKAVEQYSRVRPPQAAPEWLPPVPEALPIIDIPSPAQLGILDKDVLKGLSFKGGTTAGFARIQHYFFDTRLLSTYKETRNGLLGMDYSSKLSPWLSTGALSARMVWDKVKAYESDVEANDSTYWLIFELLWRDYFKYVSMKYGHRIFLKTGIRKTAFETKNDRETFRMWCQGETDNDFVDANMLELLHTGFMSNRGRQNAASYLCKDLQIDWTWGAAWFESQLIDYDPASNWGNWMYIAGVGNDPREGRYFNTRKQADTYDSDKSYRHYWLENQTIKTII
jgi:deoxyribodipyrimidine photo-lyase